MSVVVSTGTVSISSGVTSTGLEVVKKGELRVLNGGRANETEVADGGSAVVSKGGRLYVCSIASGGTVKVLNGGDAETVTVGNGGLFLVSSGGETYESYIESGGVMRIYADVTAVSAFVKDGGELYIGSKAYARSPVVSQGGAIHIQAQGFILGGQIAGTVYVDSGAANSAWILPGGAVSVTQMGYAYRNSVRSGASVQVFSGGSANSNTIYAGGGMDVFSGGSAYNTMLSGGLLHVESGALAANTSACSGGSAAVSSGGYANGALVRAGGTMTVLSGGTATGVKEAGGWVEYENAADVSIIANSFGSVSLENASGTIHSGTTAVDVGIGPGGFLTVFSGGTATGVKEAGGWVEYEDAADVSFAANAFSGLSLGAGGRATVHSGTTASDFEVKSGGTMHVFEGGRLAGTMMFEAGATVSVESGVGVSFDLTRTSAGAAPLLNDLSVLNGGAIYSLTVDSDLDSGAYRYALAGGAAAFDGVLTVRGEDGKAIGTISVGETLFIGETSYLLGILDAVLTLTVIVPDLTPPVVSEVRADPLELTNQDVIVTALFSDDVELAATFYRIGDGEWLEYVEWDGVTVTENATVSFKAVDTSGNESDIVSYEVTNIDKTAPVITLTGDTQTPAREAPLTAVTEDGVDIFYSADRENWTRYDGVITVVSNGTYSFRATDAAENTSTAEIVFANILPAAPRNPVGTKDRVSWDANGAPRYVVEYSTDNFTHVLRVTTLGLALDMADLPAGTYQWRVRADDRTEWTVGEDVVSDGGAAGPEVLESNGDGSGDIFFAETDGTWGEKGYFSLARHVGSVNDWNGTNELIFIEGKGRILNLFFGSADPNILCLTAGDNGDALFLDDVYTVLPEDVAEHQARIANIHEIRAGAGDDVIDLTSQRFEYTGGGMIVRGGAGDDVVWANKGDNFLFGDEGRDRIVGASGNDVIVGGAGDDSLHGGGGNDVFTFCENWGTDVLLQLASGTVTLWFASGDESNWDAGSLTYADGENSVKVSGVTADRITLKFGDDGSERFATLSGLGAFESFASQRIFEENGTGVLASQ